MKHFAFIFFLFLFSCEAEKTEQVYLFDVLGDSAKETITVEANKKNPSGRDIFIQQTNGKTKICTILTDGKFSNTNPAIENVYLEANNIQTDKKGFRIIVRNTDMIPDTKFIDVRYKKEWMIEKFGIVSTVSDAKHKPYSCTYDVNRTIESFQKDCGDHLEISMVCFMVNMDIKFDCQ